MENTTNYTSDTETKELFEKNVFFIHDVLPNFANIENLGLATNTFPSIN